MEDLSFVILKKALIMRKIFLLICVLFTQHLFAQHEADNWYFGTFAGLTFSTNPPSYLSGGQINTPEGCSSVSDAAGNLLFYSDGILVWDRNSNVMPNGMGLLGGASSTQSCVVVPLPGSSTSYFLFTPPQASSGSPLTFSMVDMNLNSGLGDVINKNMPLFSPSTEKVTAVRHHNGTDYWVVGHAFNSNSFFSYLVTSFGVNSTPVISNVGTVNGGSINNTFGYLKSSPCGNKLANAIYGDDIFEMYDFNDSTGVVSNPLTLATWTGQHSSGVYGTEFSPDNTKLYASIITPAMVIQYDLTAASNAAIIASADTVGVSPTNFNGALQNGPDGRMYLAKYGDSFVGCITQPNLAGASCAYVENYVSISPATGTIGLPNFLPTYFCGLQVNVTNPVSNNIISLYPNPSGNELHVQLNQNPNINSQVEIINSIGQTVYRVEISNNLVENEISIPLADFKKGVYILKLINREGISTEKFLIN